MDTGSNRSMHMLLNYILLCPSCTWKQMLLCSAECKSNYYPSESHLKFKSNVLGTQVSTVMLSCSDGTTVCGWEEREGGGILLLFLFSVNSSEQCNFPITVLHETKLCVLFENKIQPLLSSFYLWFVVHLNLKHLQVGWVKCFKNDGEDHFYL